VFKNIPLSALFHEHNSPIISYHTPFSASSGDSTKDVSTVFYKQYGTIVIHKRNSTTGVVLLWYAQATIDTKKSQLTGKKTLVLHMSWSDATCSARSGEQCKGRANSQQPFTQEPQDRSKVPKRISPLIQCLMAVRGMPQMLGRVQHTASRIFLVNEFCLH
jgi:hypothetical protein